MVLAWSWRPALFNQCWKLDAVPLPIAWLITPWYKRLRPADEEEVEGREAGREGGSNNSGCKAIKAPVNVDWVSLRSRRKTEECASVCAHVGVLIWQHAPVCIRVYARIITWMDVWSLVGVHVTWRWGENDRSKWHMWAKTVVVINQRISIRVA